LIYRQSARNSLSVEQMIVIVAQGQASSTRKVWGILCLDMNTPEAINAACQRALI
jgi:hypothetical protein